MSILWNNEMNNLLKTYNLLYPNSTKGLQDLESKQQKIVK